MYPDLTITITRRPNAYLVMLPLWLGIMLSAVLIRTVLSSFITINERSPVYMVITTTFTLCTMAGVFYLSGLAPQGKLEFHGKKMRASMLFRKTRVFDLRETTVALEQWNGPRGLMGPMLAFDQGQTHFRVGCYDYDGGQLLTPVRRGAWFPREPHGTTKCADFYALAELLGVHVPKPAGWRLQEVL